VDVRRVENSKLRLLRSARSAGVMFKASAKAPFTYRYEAEINGLHERFAFKSKKSTTNIVCIPRIHSECSSHDPRAAYELTDNDQSFSSSTCDGRHECVRHQIHGSFSRKSEFHGISVEAISDEDKKYLIEIYATARSTEKITWEQLLGECPTLRRRPVSVPNESLCRSFPRNI
jgi:hypothetical protein